MKFMSRLFSVACLVLLSYACGGGGSSPIVFNPPEGSYADPLSVSITVAGASAVYITTDGSIPTLDDCGDTPYVQGDPIQLDANSATTINVLYIINETESLASASYVIGTVSAGPYVNRDMLDDWRAWSDELRNKFPEPSGTGHVGTFTCDNGGTFDWNVPSFFLSPCAGGVSTFTYSNCAYTDAGGTTLIATGSITGRYCQDGSGSSSGSVTLTSGAGVLWTGSVDDSVHNNSSRQPIEPAKYTTSCDQANCEDGVKYLWSNSSSSWVEVPPPTGGFGCSAPWVQIRHNNSGSCLVPNGSLLNLAACDVSDENQQWIVSEATGLYTLQNVATGLCAEDTTGSDNFGLATCNASNDDQTFEIKYISGSGADQWFIREEDRDACMYRYSGFNSGNVYAAGGNCTWATLGYPYMKWGFYVKGEGADVGPSGAVGN